MDHGNQAAPRDDRQESLWSGAAARLLPRRAFGARAAVLAGVVATACATAAPAASAAAATAPAAHAAAALHGAAGGFLSPRDSTCCM